MTLKGRVKNGVIVVDKGVSLPEGAEVTVDMPEKTAGAGEAISDTLLRHAGKGIGLPSDLAERHDHYAHGRPRA
jgi:hypothetical protein